MNVISRLFTHAKGLCLLTAALALGGIAQATTFDFSYTFGDGTTVTGSLDGTANGSYVDNVSNISLFINSTAVGGTIFSSQYDEPNFSYIAGPVVSFNASLNNFVFSNSDLAGGDFGFTSYFSISPSFGGTSASVLSFDLGLTPSDSPVVSQSWSLTAQTSNNVPDGATTAGLVGVAALGLIALRRRFAA